MIYRVIGVMSGSSLDGLDIVFTELQEVSGQWTYEIKAAACIPYTEEWTYKLENSPGLSAAEYLKLNSDYGSYIGQQIRIFIDRFHIHHQVQLIACHGHTVFHDPANGFTAQLGSGAAIAATTEINVVNDLRAIDVAFGGQGAPIVPIGEKLLFSEYPLCLNLGGIANLSHNRKNDYVAFDVCPANRVLNMLARSIGKEFDDQGHLAAEGNTDTSLLTQLNALPYYSKIFPKSLPNSFGTDTIYPLVNASTISLNDKLHTYVEHIVLQVGYAVQSLTMSKKADQAKMLVTGGGAKNTYLVNRLKNVMEGYGIEIIIPDDTTIHFKEALIMGLMGVLRWREEYNVLHTVTGAERSSIGGAVWIGQEA